MPDEADVQTLEDLGLAYGELVREYLSVYSKTSAGRDG
jgi:hypothetical protein